MEHRRLNPISTSSILYLALVLNQTQGCNNGDIQLADGPNEFEGRLEVCYQEIWEPVCQSTFRASGICNQLGFNGGTTVSLSVPSKAKSSLNITCPREAVSTNNCTLTKINNFACKENFNGTIDVTYLVCSANCQVGQIRLVSGTSEVNGHIEVCSGLKIWAGICDSHWDVRDAEVACRELGLLKHNEVPTAITGLNGLGTNSISACENAQCVGSESRLIYCQHSSTTRITANCSTAGLICSGPYVNILQPTVTQPPEEMTPTIVTVIAIIGSVVGVIVVLLLVIILSILLIICCRKKKNREREDVEYAYPYVNNVTDQHVSQTEVHTTSNISYQTAVSNIASTKNKAYGIIRRDQNGSTDIGNDNGSGDNEYGLHYETVM